MKLKELYEAKISGANVNAAMVKIISYLEKSLGVELIKVPGIDHFENSVNTGYGIRYVISGTTRCIRFNWESEPSTGKSNSIESIDVWMGGKHDPSFHIQSKGISLVKILPSLVQQIQKPKVGDHKVFAGKPETVAEAKLNEAKRGDFTPEQAIENFLMRLSKGQTLTRSDFIGSYHITNAPVFDTLVRDFSEKIEKQGARISALSGVDMDDLKHAVLATSDGILQVIPGGSSERSLPNGEEEAIEDPEDRISFTDSIKHLEGLVQGLIKGSFNALFVAGKGGTGKTQTVEDTLEAAGLRDGDGYFKNTGSASAIGIYGLLYKHRKDIILFDDSDGALNDQDARNLIKAATDTKKSRKLVWNKKSSNMYDPDFEAEKDVDDDEFDGDRLPKYFNFNGRIIFISNLPLQKLDPDGALRTRAFVISINPTSEELLERMNEILHTIKLEDGLSLSKKEREGVMDVIKTGKRMKDVSLRTLVRGLNLKASGAPNADELIRLYA